MSPEERDKARRGLRRFEHMSRNSASRHAPCSGRCATCRRHSAIELRERWSQMTPEQRRDWVRDNPPPAKPR